MTFRPGPLRAAAILAAGFVVARVVYRILFHGVDGDGPVLLDLPAVRLPSPFAHVVLLGPVTVDGLWDAAASALPIALAIVAFGVVNAVVDVHRVLARGSRRGPLRGVARALAIAAATLPSLADGARAVRFAQRLRGEHGGARMLLPLLERTLERAGNVAAALELRGFAGRGLDGDCRAPVEAHDVEIGFGELTVAADPPYAAGASGGAAGASGGAAGRGIRVPADLALEAGTLTLVAGPTGAGKTTLLRTIAGLHSHVDGGWIAGSLRVVGHERDAVPPRDVAQRVGVVLQHPREAFATERVRDEIGLSLELRAVAPVIAASRVAEVADRVGVTALLDRPTRGLSAGEATVVAIAAAIVEHPILLLVDEPLADLDAGARRQISRLLDALAHEAGMCVVVAEHRVEALSGIADLVLRVDEGEVARVDHDDVARVDDARLAPPTHTVHAERVPAGESLGGLTPERVLTASALTVRHRDRVAVRSADVELYPGEIVALVGPNGAGKSSLLGALALPGRAHDVRARGRVALVPDASDDLFVSDTVSAECARADRRAARMAPHAATGIGAHPTTGLGPHLRGRRGGGIEEIRASEEGTGPIDPRFGRSPRFRRRHTPSAATRFAGFLGLDPAGPEFAARLARHPRDLSAGERRCLALAIQLAWAPSVLLVDEPTRGLDPAARELIWDALSSLAAGGTAVLVASHEPGFTARADRTLAMHAGILTALPAATPPASVASAVTTGTGTAPPRLAAHATLDPGGTATHARAAVRIGTTPADGSNGGTATPLGTDAAPAAARQDAAPATARGVAASAPPPSRGAAAPAAAQGAAASVRSSPSRRRGVRLPLVALAIANVVALGAFCWPLVATAVPEQAHSAVPVAALALVPLAALVVVATLDGTVRSAHMLALLGTLAAIGTAVRIAGTGVGGVEAVFILLILAGRAFGARFGMLLGMATIALSTLITGTFGPWTPFQMFACAWVGAVAGLLPRRLVSIRRGPRRGARRSIGRPPAAEIAMLCVYGIAASYVFGLLMNLWFWPFAVGYGTGISYDGGAPLDVNLSSFLLYSLVTSTLSWDTLRAITTVVGLLVVGRPVLAALRRTKPLSAATQPPRIP